MDTTKIVNYDLIGNCKLTPQEQLKVLEDVLTIMKKQKTFSVGLCFFIRNLINSTYDRIEFYSDFPKFIPIFNKENADVFGNAISENKETEYWWICSGNYSFNYDYDLKNRIQFIKWMIEVIKYDIKNNK